MTVLTSAKPAVTPTETSRPITRCWKCGRQGHLCSGCPQTQPLNSRKPRRPPRPREPGKEKFWGGSRRASERTPRHTPREWQKPRRTSQPERRQEPFTLPLTNRFSQLPETELAGEVHPDIGGEHTPLCQRSLIFRGLSDHATNRRRPAWPRPSMLGK